MSEIALEVIIDESLKKIGFELMFCTPEKCANPDGITAIELARKLNLETEIVRKKLKILQSKGIARAIGINPKLWKFDDYNFQKMDENDPVYKLLCDYEGINFCEFFEY
jgi:hypothetical protein